MSVAYTIHAVRDGAKKRIECATATEVTRQRTVLLADGWGISVANNIGVPVADRRVDEMAAIEAELEAAKSA